MHGRFKFEKLKKYPHMKPADVAVWERFVSLHPDFFDTVDYDFHVGEGAEFLPTGEDTADGRENRLYQIKIDVVGYKDKEAWIIEVKPTANSTALGQALGGKDLFEEQSNEALFVTPLVVAGSITQDMAKVYEKRGVVAIIV